MEQLQDILGAELYSQVTNALKGKAKDGKDIVLAAVNDGTYIPKAKFDDLNTELKGYKDQITQRDKDIAALKKNSGDNETLKTQLKELQTNYQAETENLNKTIKNMQFDGALTQALNTAKAKNPIPVKAMLNLDDIKYEDGKIMGLEAQLENLQKEHSYLFDAGDNGGSANPGYEYKPAGGGEGNPDFTKMSDAQYYAYMAQQQKG
ncbi:MAG: phage scaffolding protein [Clostridiales bacterium]